MNVMVIMTLYDVGVGVGVGVGIVVPVLFFFRLYKMCPN